MDNSVLDAAKALGVSPRRLSEEGLAGLALSLTVPAGADRPLLVAEARRQAGHRLLAEREVRGVLRALADAGIDAAPWKGLAVAEYWQSASRPVGDLDLLLAPQHLERAAELLLSAGYRRAPEARAGLLRRGPTGVELLPPEGRVVTVDLHERAFRSVGHRIETAPLLARSTPALLANAPVLRLDVVDHFHLLLVHAAKHALTYAKWRLDLVAVASLLDAYQWSVLEQRIALARTERPVALAIAVLGPLARTFQLAVAPTRASVARIVTKAWSRDAASPAALSKPERYLLEWALEPGLRARARMVAGIGEAWLRGLVIR